MSKLSLLLCGLCLALFCHGQSGLNITGASSFSIKANTTVIIDGLTLTPSALYTISSTNNLKRTATLSHPSITPSINRSFQWNTTLTAFTGNIGFYYNEAELNGLAEPDLTLNVHDGSQWQAYTVGVIRNTTTNLVTTPVTNIFLNEISLAAEVHPLPLKWGHVTATREKETARINWETYNEFEVSFFTIERSIDGLHWYTIENQIPAINKPGLHPYYFYDNTISNSKTFYRIKQVDNNLQYSYSPVAQVAAVPYQIAISIFPNPATQQVFIQSKDKLIKTIHVYSANGQLLLTTNVLSITQHTLPLEAFSKGAYTIQVTYTDNTTSSVSFLKN